MEDKKKNILIAILIVGILTITVAFAALSSTLTIKSAATIKGGSWEVLFVSGTGPSAPTSAPASGRSAYFNGAPSLTATVIQNINAVLTQPGDTLTYNFKIRNNGTIDAKLDIINSVTPTCTPSGDDATTVCNNITRSLKYVSAATKVSGGGAGTSTMTADSPVTVGDVLKAGEEISVDLTISYASGTTTSSFPATDVTVSYPDQVLTYVQDDGETHGLGGNPIDEHDPVLNNYVYDGGKEMTLDGWDYWNTELNPNLVAYYRKNTSTDAIEVCGVFQNGTVCLTNSSSGYSSDFNSGTSTTPALSRNMTQDEQNDEFCYEDDYSYTSTDGDNKCYKCALGVFDADSKMCTSTITGYTRTKLEEMISKGATYCEEGNDYAFCYMSSEYEGSCGIDSDGSVSCSDYRYTCVLGQDEYDGCGW